MLIFRNLPYYPWDGWTEPMDWVNVLVGATVIAVLLLPPQQDGRPLKKEKKKRLCASGGNKRRAEPGAR